jgi:hypothetical protein
VLKARRARGDRACDGRAMTRRSALMRSARATCWPGARAGRGEGRPEGAAKTDETDLPGGPTLHGAGAPAAVDMNQFKIVIPARRSAGCAGRGQGGQKIRKG